VRDSFAFSRQGGDGGNLKGSNFKGGFLGVTAFFLVGTIESANCRIGRIFFLNLLQCNHRKTRPEVSAITPP